MIIKLLKKKLIDILCETVMRWFIINKIQDMITHGIISGTNSGCHIKELINSHNLEYGAAIVDEDRQYKIYVDNSLGEFYITVYDIVVFLGCGGVTDAADEFMLKQRYIKALELAATGQWTNFRLYVKQEWQWIIEEMGVF